MKLLIQILNKKKTLFIYRLSNKITFWSRGFEYGKMNIMKYLS